MLHFGQGKWYPGEQLPRWALNCHWRKDGEAIWRDPHLYAVEDKPTGATPEMAHRFALAFAQRLQLDPGYLFGAFEDTWYYLWRERRLPSNVDGRRSQDEGPMERERLARVFEQGLETAVGYRAAASQREHNGARPLAQRAVVPAFGEVLPDPGRFAARLPPAARFAAVGGAAGHGLHRRARSDGAASAPCRRSTPSAARRCCAARNAACRPTPTATATSRREAWRRALAPDLGLRPGVGHSAGNIVRTAISFEPRDGHLFVFMPPTERTEDYLDLVTAVEDTAEELGQPVFIEGYPPPGADPRLQQLQRHARSRRHRGQHPSRRRTGASSWTRRRSSTRKRARRGWAPQKFMIDGRHTGTGGGNHVTLGGPSAADSPLLRRPDLLKSLLGYWHNHPSLSYLFSGLFIGPTSQHPRVDEARNDALHELEIAFRQIKPGEQAPPWLVDRIFRNLLVDATGNTHRTEFCIDKLFTPDAASGRRGLLELRAFEMPPHWRMSVAQQALLRGLVAKFWDRPYERTLTRWGTRLHDDFMLPHFVWQDFSDVLADLAEAGYRFAARLVRAAFRVPLPARSARWRSAASSWNCAMRWNPGTCWARSRAAAARCAMSTARSSACRSRSSA